MKTAHKLQSMGRNGDTLLAHINPQEAHLLKSVGGSGTRNPKTGLLEFSFGDGIQADPGDPNSGGGTYGGGDGGFGGPDIASMYSLPSIFSTYNGMMGGVAPAVEETPNADMPIEQQYAEYGRGRQLAEQAAGYGMGATKNALGDWAAKYATMNPVAKSLLGGWGAISAMLGGTSLGTNTRGATGISQSDPFSPDFAGNRGTFAGNGFDGGNLPRDNASTPGGLLGTNPVTPTPPAATPYVYNRPAFTPTFGQLRTANFTNPYSRRGGLLGG